MYMAGVEESVFANIIWTERNEFTFKFKLKWLLVFIFK